MPDLYLATGHGMRSDGRFDPGARGEDGRYEHYEAHEVVATAADALQRSGVSLVFEAHGSGGPEDPNFAGSVKAINRGSFTCAVEVHFDWSKAPRGGFGHWYSKRGQKLADNVMARWKADELPVRDNWHKRRTDLTFLKKTRPPAMLWECDRISDYPREFNARQGEAIAAGICDFLGKTYVAPSSDRPHADVAVIGLGEVDGILAYLLGRQHGFRVLTTKELPKWDVDWLVKVGGGAVKKYASVPGHTVAGGNRYETAQEVLARIVGDKPERARAWEHLNAS